MILNHGLQNQMLGVLDLVSTGKKMILPYFKNGP
jgi:hypothetical protein